MREGVSETAVMEAPVPENAILWQALDDGVVRCGLCAHHCRIAPGGWGRCAVRRNGAGTLRTHSFGALSAAAADPIEKKPLFHVLPGSLSFSVATPGCNFQCDFCQNWELSQGPRDEHVVRGRPTTPEQVVACAREAGCASIAYTYSEPTIFFEWAAACGRLARSQGLANVFVSNGFFTREALTAAEPWLDAINVDLKAFTEDFYAQHCGARLAPVLETIRAVARETAIWLEVTTLLIPGLNDGDDELRALADWLVAEAGPEVPWHVSRFFPRYRSSVAEPTPVAGLQRAGEIGRAAGLRYVYSGNLPGVRAESTFCHVCGELLVERVGYTIRGRHLVAGACPRCGTALAGRGL